jgi:hypothetical protein
VAARWNQQHYKAPTLGSGLSIQEYVIATATNGAALNELLLGEMVLPA